MGSFEGMPLLWEGWVLMLPGVFVALVLVTALALNGPGEALYAWARARLAADPAFSPESGPVTEFRLELPYEFDVRDYEQILSDARGLVPALSSAA